MAEGRRRVVVEPSLDALLERVDHRELWKNSDSLSGSTLERATVDGQACVIKYVCVDDDWIMRATGDLHCRQLTMHESHVLDDLPATIDDALLTCAPFISPQGHRGAALLMRDVSAAMIPAGSALITMEQHRAFLTHMAQMHAAYWGFQDTIGLIPLAHHYMILTPSMAETERGLGGRDPVPFEVAAGWRRLAAEHPDDAALLLSLSQDPTPLTRVLSSSPQTLVQADWKLGNLGAAPGRTFLLDWDRAGQASPLIDLAWYLSVNCERLPESKENAIDAYRDALESSGVDTGVWWDTHLPVALAGAFLQLVWAKLDGPDEYAWWSRRLQESRALL